MSSTDLEFRRDLSKINLSPIQIQTPEPAEAPFVARTITIQRRNRDSNSDEKNENENENDQNCDEMEGCRTPTSERHRIPKILSCPGAPRKPARRVLSCKRKLTELQFFEVKKREEVDEYFRSSFEILAASKAKRSCCSLSL